jgi:SAM-dependent methyltransferase
MDATGAGAGANALDRVAARHALVGPPDLWQMKRRFQIDFLRSIGLEPRQRLLDLGCGTLRGGIPLIAYLDPGHHAGVEVRQEVLDEGRRELEENGLADRAPQLVHCPRLAELDLGRRFDVARAFAVLIHMDDAILDEAVAAVARHLDDGGVFYASANVGSEPSGTWQGFPVVHREEAFYADVFRRHGLILTDLGPLTSFGHQHPRLAPEAQARQRMLRATKA